MTVMPIPIQSDLFYYTGVRDAMCERLVRECPSLLIPWYLMACYAYEKLAMPILSDAYFDEMSSCMASLWSELEHPHKDLISMGDPASFKGSSITVDLDNLPSITKDTAMILASQQE